MEQFILVRSKDRLSGSSSSFTVKLNESVRNVRRLLLQQCYIPYSFYNVVSTNLVFEEQAGGGVVTIPIPEQHYTFATLGTQIKTLLDSNSPNGYTYTVTYSTSTGKYTISTGANFRLIFSPLNPLYRILGFNTGNRGVDSTTAYALSHTSSGSAQIYTPYLILSITPFDDNITGSSNTSKGFQIPVTGNFQDVLIFTQNSIDRQVNCFSCGSTNIYQMTVNLYDPDGNLIDLNGGEIDIKFAYETYSC